MSFCPYYTMYEMNERNGLQAQKGFSTHKFYAQILGEIGRASIAKESNLLHRIRPEAVFYENSQPVYRLYPAIGQALLTTKIDIPVSEINLPFESFVINLHKDLHIPTQEPTELCSILVNMFTPKPGSGSGRTRELAINYQTKIRRDDATSEVCEVLEILPDLCPSYDSDYIIDFDSYYIEFPLLEGQTLEQCYEQYVGSNRPQAIHQKVLKIVLGTIFLAISQDKRYVKKYIQRIKSNQLCFCGSGKKYKKCCKLRGIQNVGYDIGKDIVLATEQKPGTTTIMEGRGKELLYGHVRTGHMRWQWYNDERGRRRRKLIFIHPLIVRPDLPMKPRLTPRSIRRPKKKPRDRNPRRPAAIPRSRRTEFFHLSRPWYRGTSSKVGEGAFAQNVEPRALRRWNLDPPKARGLRRNPPPGDYMRPLGADCWIFARALHEVTGLPIYGSVHEGEVHHAFVLDEQAGMAADGSRFGFRTLPELLSKVRGDEVVPLGPKDIAKWIGAGGGKVMSKKKHEEWERKAPREIAYGYSDKEWAYAMKVARKIARDRPAPKKLHVEITDSENKFLWSLCGIQFPKARYLDEVTCKSCHHKIYNAVKFNLHKVGYHYGRTRFYKDLVGWNFTSDQIKAIRAAIFNKRSPTKYVISVRRERRALRRNPDKDLRQLEREFSSTPSDVSISGRLIAALQRSGDDISYSLWRQHESNLLPHHESKNSQQNIDKVLDVLQLRNDIPSLYVETIYDWEALVDPSALWEHLGLGVLEEHSQARLERRHFMLGLIVWIEAGWRPAQNRFARQHLSTNIDSYDEIIMLLSQQVRLSMRGGNYRYSSHLGRFGELVYVAAHEYMAHNGIDGSIREVFPKKVRDYLAEYLLWQCETLLANREFNWQALNLPMRGSYSDAEVAILLRAQSTLGRDLTAKETFKYKGPGRELPERRRRNPQGLRVGDLVIVNRPRGLPSRIGKITRLGKKVYVLIKGQLKPKRYSYASVEVLLRTGIKIDRNPEEPKGVPKHRYFKKGAKTVCTSAVLAAFEIDSCSYHYSGKLKQRLNLLRKNGWAARSRNSHVARGFRKLKIKSGAKSVGKVRRIIAYLNKDEPETNDWGDPTGTRYMIRVVGHALLLDYHGNTIVDTAPRLRDKRKVLDIRAVFRPTKDDESSAEPRALRRRNPDPKKKRAQILKRLKKFEKAKKEGRWPYGSYPDPCEHCEREVDIKSCSKFGCWAPNKHFHMWQTSPAKWKKLPVKYRKKILCKKCFKKLSGVSPGPHYWGRRNPFPRRNPDETIRRISRKQEDPHDKAQLIAVRVRLGEITRDDVLKAAYLGNEAALLYTDGETWVPRRLRRDGIYTIRKGEYYESEGYTPTFLVIRDGQFNRTMLVSLGLDFLDHHYDFNAIDPDSQNVILAIKSWLIGQGGFSAVNAAARDLWADLTDPALIHLQAAISHLGFACVRNYDRATEEILMVADWLKSLYPSAAAWQTQRLIEYLLGDVDF